MRIRLVTAAAPSPNLPSQALYNVAQAGGLSYIGHDADILTFRPALMGLEKVHPRVRRTTDRPDVYTHDGVTIHSVPVPWMKSVWMRFTAAKKVPWAYPLWTQLAMRRVLRRELDGIDAVVVHGTYPLGLAVAACIDEDIPIAVVEHSLSEVDRLPGHPELAKMYRKLSRRAARMFGVSPLVVEYLERGGIENAELLLNGAGTSPPGVRDVGPLHERSGDRRVPGKPRKIVTLGQFIEKKGLVPLLEALARVALQHDVRLVHIGGVSPPPNVLERVRALKLEDRVEFMGHQPNERVLEIMRDSDIFALPSWDESFGIVYAEALSVGTPVILTESCGFSGYIEDGVHGRIIQPKSVDALATALDDLLTRDDLDEMGRVGAEMVRQTFSWEANALRLEAALLGAQAPE